MTDKIPVELLPNAMEALKRAHPAIGNEETEFLCKQFNKIIKPKDGFYDFSTKILEAFFTSLQDAILMDMADKGFVDIVWMEEYQEFGFMLTEAGKKMAEETRRDQEL